MINALLQALVVIALPPLLLGIISRVKAIFAGRRGPPLLQLYWDLAKLWQKRTVLSSVSTPVFRLGPVVAVVTALMAAMLIPMGGDAPVSFTGDMIVLAYLLALGRFFTVSAALDTGSAFEGMGASREVTFSSLAEPALFLGFVALTRMSHGLPMLGDLLSRARPDLVATGAGTILLVAGAWFIVFLAENCRIPFDDPNTHLELTMIHEVMVLDHGGPPLALVLYGAAVKLLVIGALVVRLCIPATTGNLPVDWLFFLGGLGALAIGVGVIESVMARLRLIQVPYLLISANFLAALGVALILR